MSQQCELPKFNAASEEIQALLKNAKIIAVVGLSTNKEKTSYMVAQYLKNNGFTIIPVNPKAEEILGERCYASLEAIPTAIDIVNIFRKPDAILGIAEETIKLKEKPKGFWMQLGLAHNKAATLLKEAGITVVQSKCIKVVHQQMCQ